SLLSALTFSQKLTVSQELEDPLWLDDSTHLEGRFRDDPTAERKSERRSAQKAAAIAREQRLAELERLRTDGLLAQDQLTAED
ncbi:unnamed protein product, partial [Amoebophrya sp. A25]